MYTALVRDTLVYAYDVTDDRATCPGCRTSVVARRGKYVAHHWAHATGQGDDCEYRGEGADSYSASTGTQYASTGAMGDGVVSDGATEVAWHWNWKQHFADLGKVEHTREGRRTDVWTTVRGMDTPGRAFEFQSKPIDLDLMIARQRAWGNVVWLLDGRAIGIRYMGPHNGWDSYSWRRVPPMIWKGINPWVGAGGEVYVQTDAKWIIRVIEVEFNRGLDNESRVTAETETVDSWISRFRKDAE